GGCSEPTVEGQRTRGCRSRSQRRSPECGGPEVFRPLGSVPVFAPCGHHCLNGSAVGGDVAAEGALKPGCIDHKGTFKLVQHFPYLAQLGREQGSQGKHPSGNRPADAGRSEERRVGKECRWRWSAERREKRTG